MARWNDAVINAALLQIKRTIMQEFAEEQWQDIGLLTNTADIINEHHRLLRSLSFRDNDYGAHVVSVLHQIVEKDPENADRIQAYLNEHYGDNSIYASSVPSAKRITFAPNVFKIPDVELQHNLVAVMMPFAGFNSVFSAIKSACAAAELECLRADDIWEDSTIMQDIFNLIYRASIVVSDFSARNPNVMYETGIAHCLGKHVVPIARHIEEIPSDLRHHRVYLYLPNSEGLRSLQSGLTTRLQSLRA